MDQTLSKKNRMESAIESINIQFTQVTAQAAREHEDVTDYLELLKDEISIIHNEYRRWSGMIETTFKSLGYL